MGDLFKVYDSRILLRLWLSVKGGPLLERETIPGASPRRVARRGRAGARPRQSPRARGRGSVVEGSRYPSSAPSGALTPQVRPEILGGYTKEELFRGKNFGTWMSLSPHAVFCYADPSADPPSVKQIPLARPPSVSVRRAQGA